LGTDVLVNDFFGDEKTLQDAINDNTLAYRVQTGTENICDWKFYYKIYDAGSVPDGCPDAAKMQQDIEVDFVNSLNAIGVEDYELPVGFGGPTTAEELCADETQLYCGPWCTGSDPAYLTFEYYDSSEGFSCELGEGQPQGGGGDSFQSPIEMNGDGCGDTWKNSACNEAQARNTLAAYCCKEIPVYSYAP